MPQRTCCAWQRLTPATATIFFNSGWSLEGGFETKRTSALAHWIQYIPAVRHL